MPVQRFVDSLDGKANAILLSFCNPENADVFSRSSLVVHPHSGINRIKLLYGKRYSMRMHVPGVGYVEENRYLLRKTIDALTCRES